MTLGGGLVLGAVHGLLITRLKLQPFVVTLCGLLIYRGIARWYMVDSTQGFGYATDYDLLEWLTSGRTYNIPHTLIFLLVVAAIMSVVLHKSMFGRYLFAVGKNEEAARFSGIATSRVITAAYVLAGFLTALSSIFFVFYTQSVSPRHTATSTSCTPSPPPCWAAARCAAARARSSAFCSAPCCCRCCRTSSTSWAFPVLAQLRRDGCGDPAGRHGRPAAAGSAPAQARTGQCRGPQSGAAPGRRACLIHRLQEGPRDAGRPPPQQPAAPRRPRPGRRPRP